MKRLMAIVLVVLLAGCYEIDTPQLTPAAICAGHREMLAMQKAALDACAKAANCRTTEGVYADLVWREREVAWCDGNSE